MRIEDMHGRRMSFAETKEQIENREKWNTRRLGWLDLKPGACLVPVEKAMGLKKGERHKLVGDSPLIVQAVRRERLDSITFDEVALEGFPDWSPARFVDFFCSAMNCKHWEDVTVVDFHYLAPHEGLKAVDRIEAYPERDKVKLEVTAFDLAGFRVTDRWTIDANLDDRETDALCARVVRNVARAFGVDSPRVREGERLALPVWYLADTPPPVRA